VKNCRDIAAVLLYNISMTANSYNYDADNKKPPRKANWDRDAIAQIAFLFGCIGVVYALIYIFSGDFSPFAHNWFNSYSRQAALWLDGRLDLPYNVTWLEIASFDGRYFISFPPFPSLVMLPFVWLLGTAETPDHVIALGVALIAALYAYRLAVKLLGRGRNAVFAALFLILGTNYLHVALWGGVWYIAQNMAFALTLIALYHAMGPRRRDVVISLLAMCAAMGTRPFNAVVLPLVLVLIYRNVPRADADIPPRNALAAFARRVLLCAMPALVLGGFFMWLNYTRFGSIFEFGHNYLPEFVYDPHGQFYPGRILSNLQRMLFNFDITASPMFHGFAFWVASPLVVTYVVYLARHCWLLRAKADTNPESNLKSNNKADFTTWLIPVLAVLQLLAFSTHRTLGGHQFGARYTVDILPLFFVGWLFLMQKRGEGRLFVFNAIPALFGLLLNFWGTVDFLRQYF